MPSGTAVPGICSPWHTFQLPHCKLCDVHYYLNAQVTRAGACCTGFVHGRAQRTAPSPKLSYVEAPSHARHVQ